MDRPLLLNGFMATGKSSVGRAVARLAGRPFVDLDARVEERAGRSVAEIFREEGEERFRRLEREALSHVLSEGSNAVVALGGGALIDREVRLEALERAYVVALEASADELLRRSGRSDRRPLLAVADPRSRILELLEARATAYAEAHAKLGTDGRSPDAVARDALAIWQRRPVAVAAGNRSYHVEVAADVARERMGELLGDAPLAVLVTDENVAEYHAQPISEAIASTGTPSATIALPAGEDHKNVASLESIWAAALEAGADRKSRFVALGGGVVTDIAGFAAATWMRGASWVALPTTLLAMVDASVGGKTAIDLASAKNAVGAFWQPARVVCDVALLRTEPEAGFRSALSEVVKTALIGDEELLELVEASPEPILARDPSVIEEVVRRSIRVKARVVSRDERESGLRACLNLGHTVGHALEAYGGYGRLRHGEAVSLGLVAALRIGERLGLTPKALTERVVAILARFGLPIALEAQPLGEAVELIGHDKKRTADRLRFVCARRPGNVELIDLGVDELKAHALALVE